jgi:predicted metal-dependent hydrolase
LRVRPGATKEKREQVLNDWYRKQLKAEIPALLAKWEQKIGVQSEDWGIKQMRTKWGSCSIEAKRTWLNLELAKKPGVCLEYILVHELVHLLERNHNARFIALMDRFMPRWRKYKEALNKLPVRHEEWGY